MRIVDRNSAPISSQESPIIARESKVARQIASITIIAIATLLIAGGIAFAIAAPISGVHLLWIGTPACFLAAILTFGALLCTVKSSRRNEWTFMRTPQPVRAPVVVPGDYDPHGYNRGVIERIRARRQLREAL